MYSLNYWYSIEEEDYLLLAWYKSSVLFSLREARWWWLSDVADPLHIFSRHAYTHTGSGHGFRVKYFFEILKRNGVQEIAPPVHISPV